MAPTMRDLAVLHMQQRTLDQLTGLPALCCALLMYPLLDTDLDARSRMVAAATVAVLTTLALAPWLTPPLVYSRWRNTWLVCGILGVGFLRHAAPLQPIPVRLRHGPSSAALGPLHDIWRILIGRQQSQLAVLHGPLLM